MCGFGGGGKNNAAAEARASEDTRQQDVRAATGRIDETFRRFDEPFYQGRQQAFTDFANPQVDQQYARAREGLMFALADGGLTRSSVAARRLGDLERDYSQRKIEVADQARGYGQQARADVEQSRAGLVQQAASTGDAALSGNAAVGEANRLVGAQNFSPLGALFQNVAAGIGVSQASRAADRVRESAGVRTFQPAQSSGQLVNR
jgi:hypothetical protein